MLILLETTTTYNGGWIFNVIFPQMMQLVLIIILTKTGFVLTISSNMLNKTNNFKRGALWQFGRFPFNILAMIHKKIKLT